MKRATIAGLIGLLLLAQNRVFSQKQMSVPFDVQLCDRNTVSIQWTRPAADSFDYFLEKSWDEKTWEKMANIGSQLLPYYDYIDVDRAGGLNNYSRTVSNYYRIGQSKDGKLVAVSDTKSIQVILADRLYIWPTPANDILHVRSSFVNGSMDIIDCEGRLVRKITIIDSITNVPLQGLPGGMYFIHVRKGQDIFVEKFIKHQGF